MNKEILKQETYDYRDDCHYQYEINNPIERDDSSYNPHDDE
jgi:hypothetical protein